MFGYNLFIWSTILFCLFSLSFQISMSATATHVLVVVRASISSTDFCVCVYQATMDLLVQMVSESALNFHHILSHFLYNFMPPTNDCKADIRQERVLNKCICLVIKNDIFLWFSNLACIMACVNIYSTSNCVESFYYLVIQFKSYFKSGLFSTDINECNSNPCMNGGICNNLVKKLPYICWPGFKF